MMRVLLFSLSLLVIGLACTTSIAATSATNTVATTEVKPPLDSLAWTTDLDEAQKIAAENDLRVLMVFSGSDWCRPCQAFKKEVLLDASFRTAAKDKVVVLYLDFPAKKRNMLPEKEAAKNAALAEQYNRNGTFPTVLLMPEAEDATPCELKYKSEGADVWIEKISDAVVNCES